MASHKFEDLKKKCEGIKFDPMIQPRVGLTFITIPDPSIIDREASVKATMNNKKQTYVITKDFESVIRKAIAKLFCNVYKYVIQIRGKDDGIFLDPKFFSITLNTYYAGGKIDASRFIKEFGRLSNYNQEWRALSKMIHAVIVEEPDDIDRPVMEEDGISKPEGLPDSEECNGWCCWRNKVLDNNTGLTFVDPDDGLKKATEDSLFNNEIFNNASSNGEFKKLFGFTERTIPGTNVTVMSDNIRKGERVSLSRSKGA